MTSAGGHLGYISRHTAVTWIYVGPHILVGCMCWATGGGSPISENQFGGCGFQYSFGSKLRTYIHIYIIVYIYEIYIYIYMCDLYTGCVMFSVFLPTTHTLVDTYQSGALLLVRVESPISQHTAVLLGGVESRCPRQFLWTGV